MDDKVYNEIIDFLESGKFPIRFNQSYYKGKVRQLEDDKTKYKDQIFRKYHLKDSKLLIGRIFDQDKNRYYNRVVIPKSHIRLVFDLIHVSPGDEEFMHQSFMTTWEIISRTFFWKDMFEDVNYLYTKCEKCKERQERNLNFVLPDDVLIKDVSDENECTSAFPHGNEMQKENMDGKVADEKKDHIGKCGNLPDIDNLNLNTNAVKMHVNDGTAGSKSDDENSVVTNGTSTEECTSTNRETKEKEQPETDKKQITDQREEEKLHCPIKEYFERDQPHNGHISDQDACTDSLVKNGNGALKQTTNDEHDDPMQKPLNITDDEDRAFKILPDSEDKPFSLNLQIPEDVSDKKAILGLVKQHVKERANFYANALHTTQRKANPIKLTESISVPARGPMKQGGDDDYLKPGTENVENSEGKKWLHPEGTIQIKWTVKEVLCFHAERFVKLPRPNQTGDENMLEVPEVRGLCELIKTVKPSFLAACYCSENSEDYSNVPIAFMEGGFRPMSIFACCIFGLPSMENVSKKYLLTVTDLFSYYTDCDILTTLHSDDVLEVLWSILSGTFQIQKISRPINFIISSNMEELGKILRQDRRIGRIIFGEENFEYLFVGQLIMVLNYCSLLHITNWTEFALEFIRYYNYRHEITKYKRNTVDEQLSHTPKNILHRCYLKMQFGKHTLQQFRKELK